MVDHADPSGEGVTERPSRSEAVRSVVRASTGGDLEVIRFAVGPLPVPRSLGASFAYLTTRASRRADPDARKGRAAQAHAQAAAPRRRQQCQRLEAIRRSLLSWTKRDSSGRRAFRRRSRPRNRGGRASRRGRERPLCQLNAISRRSIETTRGSESDWPSGLRWKIRCLVGTQAQAERSLRLLGLERIELFQRHRIDPDVPLAEQLGALVELQAASKVGPHRDADEVRELERAPRRLELVAGEGASRGRGASRLPWSR